MNEIMNKTAKILICYKNVFSCSVSGGKKTPHALNNGSLVVVPFFKVSIGSDLLR